MNHDAEPDHEAILEAVVQHLLTSDDFDALCADAGTATLIDGDGQPVSLHSAATYRDAGVMTHDRGVYVEFSDGSTFALTITVSARGRGDTTCRSADEP